MTHIKTWRERTNARGIGSCEAMDEEINELRAALAQQGEVQHVGDTRFEGWLSEYKVFGATGYIKQDMRNAYWAGYSERAPQAPQAQEPCPNGSKCKHGAWCTEVYCQELCEFRNQPAPQPAQGEPTGCACRWDEDDNRVATCARHQGWLDVVGEWYERAKAAEAALQSAQLVTQPLSDSEIEKLREKTFSTYNPYCPVDSKSMRKAVRAAEAAHGIGEVK